MWRVFSTVVKVAVASLIVGTVLADFGITADQVLKDLGATPERLLELPRQGFAWALPNLLLGALIIVPVWLLVLLFRPPGTAQRVARGMISKSVKRFSTRSCANKVKALTRAAAASRRLAPLGHERRGRDQHRSRPPRS